MTPSKTLLAFFIMIAIVACSDTNVQKPQKAIPINNAAVASGKPLATDAGLEMYNKGGNAVDAAVATAFTLAVVEPSMSGLGGRMQAIVRLEDGQIIGIDGTTQVPTAYDTNLVSKEIYGYHVIGVPGVVAGLCTLLKDYGNLNLKTVMEPSIKLAENGFKLSKIESGMHSAVVSQLKEFEGTRSHFLKLTGNVYEEGELFIQPELANTLKLIAENGKDIFYKGEIAKRIVADNITNGGLLSLDDLANYKIKKSKVLHTTYRDYDLYGLWLPSFGAITLEIMNILESFPMDKYSETEWIKVIYEAMKLGYADRGKQYGDDSTALLLTSKTYAESLSERIEKDLYPGEHKPDIQDNELERSGHTTNLAAADENGMVVVLTQSLGPIMGSKVATPGLGFMHATASGKYLRAYEPGMRTSSHISPIIVQKDGNPIIGIGAAGGSRIVTAITNVLSRIIDQNKNIKDAILAPRVYPDPDSIHLEVGSVKSWSSEIINELMNSGLPVTLKPDLTHFGIVHGIMLDTITNKWIPAAEPDWDGAGRSTQN